MLHLVQCSRVTYPHTKGMTIPSLILNEIHVGTIRLCIAHISQPSMKYHPIVNLEPLQT
jgi:hypothetical protein